MYCAFVSHVPALTRRAQEVAGWLAALKEEAYLRWGDRPPQFSTVFIGGGTPTFLTEAELEVLMGALGHFISWEASHMFAPRVATGATKLSGSLAGPVEPAAQEITVEVNPDSLTPGKADILRRCGVNRVSLGVQSLDDVLLRILGRRHTRIDVRRAVNILKEGGFTNINFDLMFGLPGQDRDIWRRTVSEAVNLEPAHLSLYGLSVEAGTPLARRWQGEVTEDVRDLPDDDAQADMYEWAVDFLKEQGYERYETSNFAREGFVCRHNARTWRGEDYIGLGPSAVSTLGGVRTTNTDDLTAYMEGVETGKAGDMEKAAPESQRGCCTGERLTKAPRLRE
jgi:oxygen-independent coproporphyrinogen-3 oxidase